MEDEESPVVDPIRGACKLSSATTSVPRSLAATAALSHPDMSRGASIYRTYVPEHLLDAIFSIQFSSQFSPDFGWLDPTASKATITPRPAGY